MEERSYHGMETVPRSDERTAESSLTAGRTGVRGTRRR